MKRSRTWTSLLAALALLLITTSVATASVANPGVLPPASRVKALSYGEWSARWWQYVFSLPVPQNPLFGAPCSLGRAGPVGLLVLSPAAESSCDVPGGTMLFLELLSAECSTLEPPPFYGANAEELLACAKSFEPQDLAASIDGVPLHDPAQYISTSPPFNFTVPADNVFGVPAGTEGQSVAHGAMLMLAPLTPGRHTFHLEGSLPTLGYQVSKTVTLVVTR